MAEANRSSWTGGEPDISLVMPCYNEEKAIRHTIPRLIQAFREAGHRLQIVAVDNGSADKTSEIIQELAEQHSSVTPCRVEVNEGYGNGLLNGIPLCRAPWIGFIQADGPVDESDVVRLYEVATNADVPVVAKVRRRFRMDGIVRKIVSISYNLFVRLLWPTLASLDVNGNPKLIRREVLGAMQLTSKEWFLDPEVMIKAHYMGLRILEFNAFARMRGSGLSHVRAATAWEFFHKLLTYRFSRELRKWRKEVRLPSEAARAAS
jgi:dolichol-phosphate mannosyltransferase